MSVEEFVKLVKLQASDAAVQNSMANLMDPPGRVPSDLHIELSKWFNALADSDQKKIEAIVRSASESAVFGFFALLDGVRALEYGQEKGELELYYVKGNSRMHLNPKRGEQLHDLFNRLRNEADR